MLLDLTRPKPESCELLVHVAAVARVPPCMLQLIVAPCWGFIVTSPDAEDVPGLVESVLVGNIVVCEYTTAE